MQLTDESVDPQAVADAREAIADAEERVVEARAQAAELDGDPLEVAAQNVLSYLLAAVLCFAGASLVFKLIAVSLSLVSAAVRYVTVGLLIVVLFSAFA